MARLQRSERETQLLEAYLKLAAKSGTEGITLQKVADAAGVSFATVHSFFGGAPGRLTERAIAYVGADAQRFISQHLDKESLDPRSDLLAAYVTGTFEWAQQRAYSSYWVYYYYLCSSRAEVRGENQQVLDHARNRVKRLLLEGIGKGQIRGPLKKIDRLALKVHAALVGGVIIALTESTKEAFRTQREITLATIATLVAAESKA